MIRAEVLQAFQVLDGLTGYTTRDKIMDRYRGTSPCLMGDVIDFAVEQGILALLGTVYLRRQFPTKEHMDLFMAAQTLQDPSSRLQQAHEGMEALLHGPVAHPWLQLQFDRMPATTRGELNRRAVTLLGPKATEVAVKAQMLQLAAKALQAAFRSKEGVQAP